MGRCQTRRRALRLVRVQPPEALEHQPEQKQASVEQQILKLILPHLTTTLKINPKHSILIYFCTRLTSDAQVTVACSLATCDCSLDAHTQIK